MGNTMGLRCNIDSRGKAARLIWGVLLVIAGAVLLFVWALPDRSTMAWLVTAVCLAGGAFAVFEARAGWCVVRAMGFKTRM